MGYFSTLAIAASVPLASAWSIPLFEWGGYNKTSYNNGSSPNWPQWNVSSLPQNISNNGCTYGTLDHPPLQPWLNGPMPHGSDRPWGRRLANDTNPYNLTNVPNTGVTRYYNWVVTNETMSPDGVLTPMLVVNGQFPGPLLEANWGDWIEVTVTNKLVIEGTAMHWHGFLQTGTPYYDGVPGVSQCPIAPDTSFTYRFRAELYGTSWWHGHYSAQYINGLVGPIVVHGPKSDAYDIDLGPVMLTDWFHGYYQNLVEQVYFASESGPILPPMADNMLIQGKADYPCNATTLACTPNAPKAQFKFQTGKKHLLRLINHSAEALIFFSIDGYENLTVIANDFVPIVPFTTNLVKLGVGQRADIIVEGKNDPTESVWMRISEGPSGLGPTGETGCSLNTGVSFEQTAAIYYEDADTSKVPITVNQIDPELLLFPNACTNSPLNESVPVYAMPVKEPDVTLNFLMTGGYNATGAFVWLTTISWISNITFIADYNDPALLEAKLGNLDFPRERAVYDLGTNATVRIVMTSVGFPASHPMHIHGHNMQVLAEGFGSWDNSTIINPSNPQRRDTQLVRPNGYLVIQIELDNPGLWAFHCHVAWHISEGMNILLLEQTPTLQNELEIPYVMAQTCRDWSSWTGGHLVNQIDSGL